MQSAAASAPPRADAGLARFSRVCLLVLGAFVALTSIVGGCALILGSVLPRFETAISPPLEYLVGTPFTSYLVPGIVLAVVVGGLHALAFTLELTRNERRALIAASAGFALLIWVFVQMVFIPFSFLQALYFAAGLAEVGLVMISIGIMPTTGETGRPTSKPASTVTANAP